MNAEDTPRDARDGPGTAASDRRADASRGLLEQELADQQNRYLRLAVDFDNHRRRSAQDFERRVGLEKHALVRELLQVIDNLERALVTDGTREQLREGVQMTLRQLYQLLERHGYEPEEVLHQPFDPHRHEALGSRTDLAQPDHVVLDVRQRGWRRGLDVVRPAQVVINDHHLPVAASHGG